MNHLLRPDIIKLRFVMKCQEEFVLLLMVHFHYQMLSRIYIFIGYLLMELKKCMTVLEGKDHIHKTCKNILDYIEKHPYRNGKPTWKDIWITMTINSLNYSTAIPLAQEWYGKVNKIGFQFHTPFANDDPLWLPFGDIRNKIVDKIISLKKSYPDYIANTEKQILLMKGNWGGIKTTPIQCPSWAILSLDHMGRIKQPCCIGSASKGSKPICEKCGLGCYSILVAQGIKGN